MHRTVFALTPTLYVVCVVGVAGVTLSMSLLQCREFVKIGALKGNSPSEVITSCDMTFSCVSDPSALKDVSIDCLCCVCVCTHTAP